MYNEERKLKYLSESFPEDGYLYENNFNTLNRVGDAVESEFDKDISDLSYGELMLGMSLLKPISWNSAYSYIECIKKYIDWCISNGLTKNMTNLADGIRPDNILNKDTSYETLLKDPDDLDNILLKTVDPKGESVLNAYAVLLWMVYSGVDKNEAFNIKDDDFIYEDMSFMYHNKVISLPIQAKKWVIEYVNMDSYITQNGKASYYIKKADIDNFIKLTRPANKYTMKRLEYLTTVLSKEYNEITGDFRRISLNRIRKSGIFYRMFISEKNGHGPFDSITNTDLTLTPIKKDYKKWKAIFYENQI